MLPAPFFMIAPFAYKFCRQKLGLFLFGEICFVILLVSNVANAKDACQIWRENRLFIDRTLENRQFQLEPDGPLQSLPAAALTQQRPILHRTFSLSLDTAQNLSLYYGARPRTCIIAPDKEKKQTLKLPVFFVGRNDEGQAQLEEKASRARFAPSGALSQGRSFSDVSFHLRKSSFSFSEIQPFFHCGLPGLLLCEGRCPENSAALASSLVNAVVKGEFLPRQPKAPETAPKMEANEGSKPGKTPAAEQTTPKSQEVPPSSPPPNGEQPKKEAQENTPLEAQKASPQEPIQPSAPLTPAKPAASPPSERERIVLTFEKADRTPFEAAEVLLAEGEVKIAGAVFALQPEGLVAELTPEAYEKANQPELIKTLLHHYRVTAIKQKEKGYLLTVEPLYVFADRVTVEVRDAANLPVRNCSLRLEVPMDRQLGLGWDNLRQGEGQRELEFFNDYGPVYRVNLPAGVPQKQLLIGTQQRGEALALSSTTPNCAFAEGAAVSLDELRGLTLKRSLKRSGPILIAILTTDSTFASALPLDVNVFWSGILDLIKTASADEWKKKILARAQAPGVSLASTILDTADGMEPLDATQEKRAEHIVLLRAGSQLEPGPLSIIRFRPIERFHLDLVLKTFRKMEGISPQLTIGEEALLLVSGSVKKGGSRFCTSSVHGEATDDLRPQWVRQARRAFILEVWDDSTIETLKKDAQAEAAVGAPVGIYRCKIGGSDGDKVNLYGMSLAILKEVNGRAAMFSYLIEKARDFLKP